MVKPVSDQFIAVTMARPTPGPKFVTVYDWPLPGSMGGSIKEVLLQKHTAVSPMTTTSLEANGGGVVGRRPKVYPKCDNIQLLTLVPTANLMMRTTGVGVPVSVCVGVRVHVGVSDRTGVGVHVCTAVADGKGTAASVGVRVCTAVADGKGTAASVGVRVSTAVADRKGTAASVGVCVCTAVGVRAKFGVTSRNASIQSVQRCINAARGQGTANIVQQPPMTLRRTPESGHTESDKPSLCTALSRELTTVIIGSGWGELCKGLPKHS